jgi:uncharacterized protein YqeY
MSLKERVIEDMKNALRAGDKARLGAIRLLLAAVKQREVDERIELDDVAVIGVIDKMLKQRKDSIEQYQKAKRQDLVDAEQFEVSVLTAYMPQALSTAEVADIVAAAVVESGAKTIQDMSKVMALAKPKLAGRADMGEVSKLVRAKLAG